MPKASFTQSAIILLDSAVSARAIADCLQDFEVVRMIEGSGENRWMGGAGVSIAMRPEVNGYVLVDAVDRRWPDAMGDPKQESLLFGAWTLGWFGPFVYAGNLQRAGAMSFRWSEGQSVADGHTAFVRIKSSYVTGAIADDTPLFPEDYEPVAELEFVTEIARALLALPEAIAYFNPNGEVLRSLAGVDDDLAWHREHDLLPLPLWSNIRLFNLAPGWSLMDTVGMEQLDVDDHEACFTTERYEPADVDRFLRNATAYVCANGPVIEDGDTMDGPGNVRWIAHAVEETLAPRPRPAIRWIPDDGAERPDILR